MPDYPLNDFGPLMHGMVIGGLGIFHVFVAQFAASVLVTMCTSPPFAATAPPPPPAVLPANTQLPIVTPAGAVAV